MRFFPVMIISAAILTLSGILSPVPVTAQDKKELTKEQQQKQVNDLIQLIINPKTRYKERRELQAELNTFDKTMVAEVLAKHIDHEDYRVRKEVVLALGKMKYKPVFEKLKALYTQPKLKKDLREAVFEALLMFNNAEAKDFVISFLTMKTNSAKYKRSMEVIRKAPAAFVSSFEKAYLDKSNPEMQKIVWNLLQPRIYQFSGQIWGAYNSPKVRKKLNAMTPDKRKAAFLGALNSLMLGKIAKPIILKTMQNPNEPDNVRWSLARAAGSMFEAEDLPELYKLLSDANSMTRQGTLLGLADRKDPATKPSVLKLLDEEHDATVLKICVSTLDALGQSKDETLTKLEARFKERKGKPDNLMAIGGVLGMFHGSKAVKMLLEATQDKEPKVRAGGILGLYNYKDFDKNTDTSKRMMEMLGTEKDPVALRQLMLYYSKTAEPKAFDVILKTIQEHKEPELIAAALMALGKTGDPKSHETLKHFLKNESTLILKGALTGCALSGNTDAAHEIIELIKHKDWSVAFAALLTINNLGKKLLFPGLEIESMAEFKKNRATKYAAELHDWWDQEVLPEYKEKLEKKNEPKKPETPDKPDPGDF